VEIASTLLRLARPGFHFKDGAEDACENPGRLRR